MKKHLLLSLALAWSIVSAQTADQMNAFNAGKVTEYYEFSQYGGSNSRLEDPDFLNNLNYQAPRSMQLIARYRF